MSVKTPRRAINTTYFCTFTCNRWINLFSITNFYDQIYKWFDIMVEKRYLILGYVIMPNHLHVLIHTPDSPRTISRGRPGGRNEKEIPGSSRTVSRSGLGGAAQKQSLNTRIGTGKRFMAYEIVRRLESLGEK